MIDVVRINQLDEPVLAQLAELLVDAVENGASVSFMRGLSMEQAHRYWSLIASDVRKGTKILLVARIDGRVVGACFLDCDTPPNQPHRADLCKLLTHSRARRQGVARALLKEVEAQMCAIGRRLLTFDTISGGAADHLYRSAGYIAAGDIPDYALLPDGTPAPTTIFYKHLQI